MPFRLPINSTSLCPLWVLVILFRGRIAFPTSFQSEKIPRKTGQVLCHADCSRTWSSSLQGLYLQRSKAIKCSYGWPWKCQPDRLWNGQGCERWRNSQDFLWNSWVFSSWGTGGWRVWQECWLVVSWCFDLWDDAWPTTFLQQISVTYVQTHQRRRCQVHWKSQTHSWSSRLFDKNFEEKSQGKNWVSRRLRINIEPSLVQGFRQIENDEKRGKSSLI